MGCEAGRAACRATRGGMRPLTARPRLPATWECGRWAGRSSGISPRNPGWRALLAGVTGQSDQRFLTVRGAGEYTARKGKALTNLTGRVAAGGAGRLPGPGAVRLQDQQVGFSQDGPPILPLETDSVSVPGAQCPCPGDGRPPGCPPAQGSYGWEWSGPIMYGAA